MQEVLLTLAKGKLTRRRNHYLLVFVLNKNGIPLSPCKPQRARKLLKENKVKVVSYKPFTIQWIYGCSGYTQPTELSVDLGSKNIGLAITSEGKVLAKGEVELRQDVSGLLESRATLRKSRRNRKTRYRKCKFKIRNKRMYKPLKGIKLKQKEKQEYSEG